MHDILSTIKKNIFNQSEKINIGLLGLPGAIDRGNFTLIAIEDKIGPRYVIKVCREVKRKIFFDEFSIVNELYHYNSFFSSSLAKPISNSFIDNHNVMVSEYVNGNMMLPRISNKEIPEIDIAKKQYSLIETFLISFYKFLKEKKKTTTKSVDSSIKINMLRKYFNFNDYEYETIESNISGKFLYATQHGDFTRHNIITKKKGMYIIDWTDTAEKLIVDDLLYFIVNYYLQLRIETGIVGILNSFNNTFFEKNKYSIYVNDLVERLFDNLKIDYKYFNKYLTLFFVDRCIEEAKKLESCELNDLNNFSKNILNQINSENKFDTIIWYHLLKYLLKVNID
jgi:hypothetical protein